MEKIKSSQTSTTMVVGEAQEQIMFYEKIEDKQGLISAMSYFLNFVKRSNSGLSQAILVYPE